MDSTLKHAIRCCLLIVLKITIGYTLHSLLWWHSSNPQTAPVEFPLRIKADIFCDWLSCCSLRPAACQMPLPWDGITHIPEPSLKPVEAKSLSFWLSGELHEETAETLMRRSCAPIRTHHAESFFRNSFSLESMTCVVLIWRNSTLIATTPFTISSLTLQKIFTSASVAEIPSLARPISIWKALTRPSHLVWESTKPSRQESDWLTQKSLPYSPEMFPVSARTWFFETDV